MLTQISYHVNRLGLFLLVQCDCLVVQLLLLALKFPLFAKTSELVSYLHQNTDFLTELLHHCEHFQYYPYVHE